MEPFDEQDFGDTSQINKKSAAVLHLGSFTGPHPLAIRSEDWVDNMKLWPKTESPHIMAYLLKSKACDFNEMNAFRSLQSYNYLKSGWVGQVVVHRVLPDICYLKGSVCPSQALSEEAHVAWVCVKMEGEVMTAGCTCMAGMGRACSHAGAILWKIDQANRKGLTGQSCTDVSAQWNKGTKRNLEPALIENLCFKNAKAGQDVLSECTSSRRSEIMQFDSHADLQEHFKSNGFLELADIPGTMLNSVFRANISNFKETREKQPSSSAKPQCSSNTSNDVIHNHEFLYALPDPCKPCLGFYTNMITISGQKISILAAETSNQTKSDLWIESRRLRITASTASKIPKTEKGNPLKFIFTHIYKPFMGNQYTKHGIMCEPVALKQFQKRTGLDVEKTGTVVSEKDCWLSASPDGLIGENQILEIKCPVPNKFEPKSADLVYRNGSFELNSKGSRGYYMQIQIAMYCTQRTKCLFYVWLSDEEDYLLSIDYDENFINETIPRLRTFYFTQMLPKLVDDVESKRLVISNVYKQFMSTH